jgi:hypothetical protein
MSGGIKITEWNTSNHALCSAVDACLSRWKGTPYLPAHRIRAMGVDCYQVVAAFLDEMAGKPLGHTELPKLSPDIARHRPDLARAAIRRLREANGGSWSLREGPVEPGDILVVRSILRTDGHAYEGHTMIASGVPFKVLHAVRPRVCWTTCEHREIMSVYRPKEKAAWI